MSAPLPLTDRDALARNRARARAMGPDLFLHEDMAREVDERLGEVNRTFTRPVVVAAFPDVWLTRLPGARFIPDDETLNLTTGAHDLVIHAFGLHWANDPVGQLIQCRRALMPDGLFIGLTFGGRTLSELRSVLAEVEAAQFGGLSPHVAPMGEIRDLGGLLQRAGFALPVADSVLRSVSYLGIPSLARDLRRMGEGNALSLRSRRSLPGRRFAAAAEALYAASFPEAGNRIRATFEVIFLTGWAPSADQQKPLRPGSAATRLADALNAAETTLPDREKPPGV